MRDQPTASPASMAFSIRFSRKLLYGFVNSYSLVNSTKQIIGIKRLVKESAGAFREGALRAVLTMTGNQNSGQFRILAFDATLQLNTVHSWEAYVGDKATCFNEDGGSQGFFG
jgi:hypothetical protein